MAGEGVGTALEKVKPEVCSSDSGSPNYPETDAEVELVVETLVSECSHRVLFWI